MADEATERSPPPMPQYTIPSYHHIEAIIFFSADCSYTTAPLVSLHCVFRCYVPFASSHYCTTSTTVASIPSSFLRCGFHSTPPPPPPPGVYGRILACIVYETKTNYTLTANKRAVISLCWFLAYSHPSRLASLPCHGLFPSRSPSVSLLLSVLRSLFSFPVQSHVSIPRPSMLFR